MEPIGGQRRTRLELLEDATLAECMSMLVRDAIGACGVVEDEGRALRSAALKCGDGCASPALRERRRFRATAAARVKRAFLRRCRDIGADVLLGEQRAERGNVRAPSAHYETQCANASAKLERALQRILTALSVGEVGSGSGGCDGAAAAGFAIGALHRLLERIGEEAAAAAVRCASSCGSAVERARGEGGLKRRRRACPFAADCAVRAADAAALAASPLKRSRTAAEGGGDARCRGEHAGAARGGGGGDGDAMLVDVPDFGALRISAGAAAAAAR